MRRTEHQLDPIRLNALILTRGKNLFRAIVLVEQLSPEAEPRHTTHPVAQAEEVALPSKGLCR